jgi:hypothetical protein
LRRLVCRAPDGYLAVAETATHAVANFGGTANDSEPVNLNEAPSSS